MIVVLIMERPLYIAMSLCLRYARERKNCINQFWDRKEKKIGLWCLGSLGSTTENCNFIIPILYAPSKTAKQQTKKDFSLGPPEEEMQADNNFSF